MEERRERFPLGAKNTLRARPKADEVLHLAVTGKVVTMSRCNGKFHDELLNRKLVYSLAEARNLIEC